MERIEDVMRYPDDPAFSPGSARPRRIVREAQRRRAYGGRDLRILEVGRTLIKDFDLDVESGRSVAFVGPSGAASPRLPSWSAACFALWSGTVSFDDSPMDEVPREVLTGSVAVVDQDIVLFNDTIANNIRLWDTSIEDYEVIPCRARCRHPRGHHAARRRL